VQREITGIFFKLNSPGELEAAHYISTKALGFFLRHYDTWLGRAMPSVALIRAATKDVGIFWLFNDTIIV
jgi:hypothetical protein